MEPLAIYEMVIAVVLLFAKARIPEGSLYRWNPEWGTQRKVQLKSPLHLEALLGILEALCGYIFLHVATYHYIHTSLERKYEHAHLTA